MNTIHEFKDFDLKFFKNFKSRFDIFVAIVKKQDFEKSNLSFFDFIKQYNNDINWIDSKVQLRAIYYSDIKDRKAWWKLFLFILIVSSINV